MSRNLYNVIAPRDYTNASGERRTVWTQIGIAFPAKDGDGFDLQLHYIPVQQEAGFIRICVRPPMEREEGRQGGENRGRGRQPAVETRRRPGTQQAPMAQVDEQPQQSDDDIPY